MLHLCKTIVVENRKWKLAQALQPGDAETMVARSRYFGVVFQYGARFKKENMEREVSLHPEIYCLIFVGLCAVNLILLACLSISGSEAWRAEQEAVPDSLCG